MTFASIISTLTVVFTLGIKLIGFPSQIRKIQQTKNVENLSVLNFAMFPVTYLLWTIHGVLQNDATIIWGQGIGVITSGVLLGVILHYKSRTKKNHA